MQFYLFVTIRTHWNWFTAAVELTRNFFVFLFFNYYFAFPPSTHSFPVERLAKRLASIALRVYRFFLRKSSLEMRLLIIFVGLFCFNCLGLVWTKYWISTCESKRMTNTTKPQPNEIYVDGNCERPSEFVRANTIFGILASWTIFAGKLNIYSPSSLTLVWRMRAATGLTFD